jgi:hypothetical protein
MRSGESATRSGEPLDLLRLADGLLRRPDPATAGLWPRAAAILVLQALEATVRLSWERRALVFGGCPMRMQLICLGAYLGDGGLAARTSLAWSSLDRACHHHFYELAPTAAELRMSFGVVEELLGRVDATAP